MFKKKVGSDACLVLDAVYDTNKFVLESTFDLADLREASKTRVIVIRGDVPEIGTFIGICGGIGLSAGFTVFGVLNSNTVQFLFTQENGVWSALISG